MENLNPKVGMIRINMTHNEQRKTTKETVPSVEVIQQDLGNAESSDDFFSKGGIFARLFA